MKHNFVVVSVGFIALILIVAGGVIGFKTVSRHPLAQVRGAISTSPLPNPSLSITKHSLHHEIEGYAQTTSVLPGETMKLAISSNTSQFTAEVYRLGWYDEKGSQKLLTLSGTNAVAQPIPTADPTTGLLEANWPTSLTIPIDIKWASGLYMVKLTNADNYQSYIPFVIRDLKPKSLLFVHSVLTDEAYNDWGGNSLYHGSTPALNLTRAVKVSLDRPFHKGDGAGYAFTWEYPMIRFLEREGYNVSYVTDLDVHEHPELLTAAKAVIITGHDEYWSRSMRTAYEKAVAAKVNLAIFAANTSYRQIRLEPNAKTGDPDRVIVSYGLAFEHDPLYNQNNSLVATQWRSPVVNQPESSLLGAMYGEETDHNEPLVVAKADTWVLADTGAKTGDALSAVVGYEYDTYQPAFPHPPQVDVITSSPVTIRNHPTESTANSTLSTFANGAMVFNAGTTDWSAGVDEYHSKRANVVIQKMTKNILNRFLGH